MFSVSRFTRTDNISLSSSPSLTLLSRPDTATDTRPVSSDTTSVTLSVASLTPTAARCLVPQRLADIHIVRERQITGRRRHTVTANHDRAVVQRCVVLKNIDQKLARHDTIDLDARPLDLSERRAPLDDDQGAV